MARLGYVCDECGYEDSRRDPPACVKKDGKWKDLCSDCYDEYLIEQGKEPVGSV